MSTTTAHATSATRYSCLSQGSIRCVGDQPKRDKCKHCGGGMYVMRGVWGVFTWRGDDRYDVADSHHIFARKSSAESWALKSSPEYVVRWISE